MQLFIRTGERRVVATSACLKLCVSVHGVLVQTLITILCAADRTHTLEVGAGATAADVKAVVAAREGEQRRTAPCSSLLHCLPDIRNPRKRSTDAVHLYPE